VSNYAKGSWVLSIPKHSLPLQRWLNWKISIF
jgi:hypothetical protein